MAVQWTENQKKAIGLSGGTLLVSAAAGSGKTAVLVERVIRKITREEDPVGLDKLLVMTFSNAAAAQMREKISSRLFALLSEQPDNFALKRQQMLLPTAGISTVHSFCLGLIRENFSALGISHDFRVADEGEAKVLQDDAVKEVIEEYYASGSEEFAGLVELTCGFRDDKRLILLLGQFLEFVRSHPFPEQWLEQKLRLYDPEMSLSESPWGKQVLEYGRQGVSHALSLVERALTICRDHEQMEKAYSPALEEDKRQLLQILSAFDSGDFERAREAVSSFSPKALNRLSGFAEEAVKTRVQGLKSEAKAVIASLKEGCMASDEEQFARDIAWLRPKIRVLFEVVSAFDARYTVLKREKNLVDFSDIEHLALALLVRPEGEKGYRKTPLATELSARYEEILVDEYQDTNEAQDMIFKALSRNEENLFFVGDVKQSIYRFRQASPELFLEKRARFSPAGEGAFPATVVLEQNFRSCKGITEGVNFFFRQLMSEAAAEITYTKEEELVCGRQYPESPVPAVGVHLLETPEGADSGEYEAAHVAAEIKRHVEEGLLIQTEEGERPIRYGDFCILLRSAKDKSRVYEEALQALRIPVRTAREDPFFDRPEVLIALSLLQTVSNPLQDVPLTATLTSPVFGFTLDEITSLRLRERKKPLYLCVLQAAEEGDQKCVSFLDIMARLREWSAVMGVSEFIRQVYRLTGLHLLCGTASSSAKANLYLLLEYAASCEAAGYAGLTGFLRYLRRVRENGKDLPAASDMEGKDSVQIMSIHKSKGLEFSFCILADTAKQFNKQDLRQTALLHPRLGFSTMVREKETMHQYTTVPHEAVKLELERGLIAEEMRVLYVALTRPKEHLLITVSSKKLAKRLADLAAEITQGDPALSPYVVRSGKSYGDWLLLCLLRHPDCQPLLQSHGIHLSPLPCDEPWEVRVVSGEQERQDTQQEETPLPPPDETLLAYLRKQAAWVYPHLTGLPAKLSVSQLAHEERYDFAAAPAFLAREGLSPTQRGTALHKVMQFADYERARQDLKAEADRLESTRFLSPEERESLDLRRLEKLFSGPLMERILQSPRLLREVKFFYELSPQEYLGEETGQPGDPIILQGIADCVFFEGDEAVLVDYKTDRIRDGEELIHRYAAQLNLYRRALEEGLGARVKETILYSVYLGKEVRLEG